jgi:hypothetical protein
MNRIGTIERAFQIAGESETLDEIRRRLTREGYSSVDAHLTGPQIRRQLTDLLRPPQPPSATDAD